MTLSGWVYIPATIGFTVYGQVVLKWQLSKSDAIPRGTVNALGHLVGQLTNPWIFSGFGAAGLAAIAWMGALSTFPLSVAYPFMATSFVLVLIASSLLLGEPVTLAKVIAITFIVLGLVLGSVL